MRSEQLLLQPWRKLFIGKQLASLEGVIVKKGRENRTGTEISSKDRGLQNVEGCER
jgi:hypothetical protein